jgi:hypothetical protein
VKVLRQWQHALRSGNPKAVTSIYAPNALLLPTLDARVLKGRRAILPYFVKLSKKPGLHVQWHGKPTRVGPNAVAGLYRFVWDDGSLNARYTFIVKDGKIIHHHSSAMP